MIVFWVMVFFLYFIFFFFFFQAEDGILDKLVTGVQTCALPISSHQRVKSEDLMSLLIVWPEKTILSTFTYSAIPMFQSIHNLRFKNDHLRRTRDLLLPKLIRSEERRVGKECRYGWGSYQ